MNKLWLSGTTKYLKIPELSYRKRGQSNTVTELEGPEEEKRCELAQIHQTIKDSLGQQPYMKTPL